MLSKDKSKASGEVRLSLNKNAFNPPGMEKRVGTEERLKALLDPGSFVTLGQDNATVESLPNRADEIDNAIAGWGTINGRIVYVFAHDYSRFGGSIGNASSKKILKVLDLAIKNGAPIVGLHETVGVRLEEGISSLAAMAEILNKTAMASGVIPQLSIVMGPCVGISAHHPVMTDFIIMLEGPSALFLCGPDVIKQVTGEEITSSDLGGSSIQAHSGVAHLVAKTEGECFQLVRKLVMYLPANNLDDPPQVTPHNISALDNLILDEIIPNDPDSQYDMMDILTNVVDDNEPFQIQPDWAQNIIAAFARMDSRSVGILANQPRQLNGTLDTKACIKAARFIGFCDAFNIPLITFVDCPGILPSVEEEKGGIARHCSKLLYAYSEATIPKISVVTRKAYGDAYVLMCNERVSDFCLAWPSAKISVMGPKGIVSAIFAQEIAQSKNQEERTKRLAEDYVERSANLRLGVSRGYIDAVIAPHDTREWLIKGLESLSSKRESRSLRKHGSFV